MNPIAEALTGWSMEEALGQPVDDVFRIIDEQTRQPAKNPITRVLKESRIVGLANHTALISRDGTEYAIADSSAPITAADGTIQGVILVFRDVTESQRMEEEIRKNQNLESLGVLAGGIGHDFNNVLTGVIGSLTLLEMLVDKDSDTYQIAVEGKRAADRTRDLTQQLLTGVMNLSSNGSFPPIEYCSEEIPNFVTYLYVS